MTTLAPPADSSRTVDPRRSGQGRWSRRAPLLPALIFAIVVTQLPFLVDAGHLHAELEHPAARRAQLRGPEPTTLVFTDARLRAAVVNTITLTVSVVLLSVVLGLILAVLLDRKFLGRGVSRARC